MFFYLCIRSLVEINSLRYLFHPVLYPKVKINKGYAYTYFGENQLSPSSIGILPLTTSHPNLLQQILVRASPRLSTGFTLLMVSSPGFGSSAVSFSRINWKRAFHTRFRFASPRLSGVRPRNNENSPVHSSIGTASQLAIARCSQIKSQKSKIKMKR